MRQLSTVTNDAGGRSGHARVQQRASVRQDTIAASLACALIFAVFCFRGHAVAGEIWGPITAIMGIAAGLLTLASGRHMRRRGVLAVVVALWLGVALLGLAGTLDHAAPVLPEYVDQRSRPPFVPLVFSVIAAVGIATAMRATRLARSDREGVR